MEPITTSLPAWADKLSVLLLDRLEQDPRFTWLQEENLWDQWVLHTPKKPVQQSAANNCIAAVFTEEIRQKTPDILSRYWLGYLLQKEIQNQQHSIACSIHAKRCDAQLQKAAQYQTQAQDKIETIFDYFYLEKSNAIAKDSQSFHHIWENWIQLLLGIFSLMKPSSTNNPFGYIETPWIFSKNAYVNLTLAACQDTLTGQLTKAKYRYSSYINYEACLEILSHYMHLSAPHGQHHIWRIHPLSMPDFFNQKALKTIDIFWYLLHEQQGARAQANQHAYFIYTQLNNQQRYFKLYDPLKKSPIRLEPPALLDRFKAHFWEIFMEKEINPCISETFTTRGTK